MRAILITIFAVAIGIGGYVYWWNQVADLALQQTQRWKTERLANGYDIRNTPFEVSGFPYRVKLTAQETNITFPEGAQVKETTIRDFWVVVQPWKINHVIFGLENTIDATWMQNDRLRSAKVSFTEARGSAVFNKTGNLETFALDVKNLDVIDSQQNSVLADRLQIHTRPAVLAEKETPSVSNAKIQYALRLDNVTLAEGNTLENVETFEKVALSAVLEGKLSDFKNQAAILRWRDNGGIMDIQALEIIWGESQLSTNGTLALDDRNRPIGAFTAKVTGFNKILMTLADKNRLDKKAVRTAAFALNLMAKENKEGKRYLDIPLTLQEGGLFVGPLFLTSIDPVF